jgi:crossover junction endonuclease MUS81
MKLQIDFREKSIIELFDTCDTNCEIETCSLAVGDFIIKDNLSNQLYYIIERKTIEDLSASIKDGRFREQKMRLLESVGDSQRVIYIIEGYQNLFSNKKRLLPKDTLDSAIMNLMLKHHYIVFYTQNPQDTFEKLKKLYKKIVDKDIGEQLGNTNCNLISKTQKSSDNIFVNQLCMIPGVSKTIADSIAGKFSTMKELLDSYNNCDNKKEMELMLVNTEINSKRKIGKILSKKIYTSLCVSEKKEARNGYLDE